MNGYEDYNTDLNVTMKLDAFFNPEHLDLVLHFPQEIYNTFSIISKLFLFHGATMDGSLN